MLILKLRYQYFSTGLDKSTLQCLLLSSKRFSESDNVLDFPRIDSLLFNVIIESDRSIIDVGKNKTVLYSNLNFSSSSCCGL